MQSTTVKCLSFNGLTYDVPATVDEFDRLAGRAGAALDEANKNVLYRAVLNQARYGFLHGVEAEGDKPAIEGLEQLTGIERKTKVTKPEVKDDEGKITQEEVTAWDETESDFEERVYATLVQQGKYPSVEAAVADYKQLMQDVLNALPFDPSKQKRESAGPKKPTKTAYTIADELIIRCSGSIEDAVARFNARTGRNVPATRDDLARGIWEAEKAKAKERANEYA